MNIWKTLVGALMVFGLIGTAACTSTATPADPGESAMNTETTPAEVSTTEEPTSMSWEDINCLDYGDDPEEEFACGYAAEKLAQMINALSVDDSERVDAPFEIRTFGAGEEVDCGDTPMNADEYFTAAWCYNNGYIAVDAVEMTSDVSNEIFGFTDGSILVAFSTYVMDGEIARTEGNLACTAGAISSLMVDAGAITSDDATGMRDGIYGSEYASDYYGSDLAGELSTLFTAGFNDEDCLVE